MNLCVPAAAAATTDPPGRANFLLDSFTQTRQYTYAHTHTQV